MCTAVQEEGCGQHVPGGQGAGSCHLVWGCLHLTVLRLVSQAVVPSWGSALLVFREGVWGSCCRRDRHQPEAQGRRPQPLSRQVDPYERPWGQTPYFRDTPDGPAGPLEGGATCQSRGVGWQQRAPGPDLLGEGRKHPCHRLLAQAFIFKLVEKVEKMMSPASRWCPECQSSRIAGLKSLNGRQRPKVLHGPKPLPLGALGTPMQLVPKAFHLS